MTETPTPDGEGGSYTAEVYNVENQESDKIPAVLMLDRVTFGPVYNLDNPGDEQPQGARTLGMGIFGTAKDQKEYMVTFLVSDALETMLKTIEACLGPIMPRERISKVMMSIVKEMAQIDTRFELPSLVEGLVLSGYMEDPRNDPEYQRRVAMEDEEGP